MTKITFDAASTGILRIHPKNSDRKVLGKLSWTWARVENTALAVWVVVGLSLVQCSEMWVGEREVHMMFSLMYPRLGGGNNQSAKRPPSLARHEFGTISVSFDHLKIFVYPVRNSQHAVAGSDSWECSRSEKRDLYSHHATFAK